MIHLHFTDNLLVLEVEDQRGFGELSEGLGVYLKEVALSRVEVIFIVTDNIIIVQLDVLVINGVIYHIGEWHLDVQPEVLINTLRNQLLVINLKLANFDVNVFHFEDLASLRLIIECFKVCHQRT